MFPSDVDMYVAIYFPCDRRRKEEDFTNLYYDHPIQETSVTDM